MLQMMLRPRWVLALLLALGIAAGFALLGQWQLERAVEQAVVVERPTEEVLPFADVAEPDVPTEQAATGQRVEVTGSFVPGDTVIIEGRLNDGVPGYWVVAHLEVTDAAPGGLPVALGWAADLDAARAAADRFDARAGGGGDRDRAVPAERGARRARRGRRPVRDDDGRRRPAHQRLGRLRRPARVLRLRDGGRAGGGPRGDRLAAARGVGGAQLAERLLRRRMGRVRRVRGLPLVPARARRRRARARRGRGGGSRGIRHRGRSRRPLGRLPFRLRRTRDPCRSPGGS